MSSATPEVEDVHTVHTPPRTGVDADCDRHAWIDTFCGHLAADLYGREAERLLGTPLPKQAALVAMPTWTWATPAPDFHTGRKSRARDGGTLRLPIRIEWDCGPVLLAVPGVQVIARWHAEGMGREASGTTVIAVDPASPRPGVMDAAELAVFDGKLPSVAVAESVTGTLLRRDLHRMVETGRSSRWEVISGLEESFVRNEVISAATRLSIDIFGPEWASPSSLDEVALDTICNNLVLGTEERASAVQRMWQRALRPEAFRRCDPLMWVRRSLRRDAEEEVRRAIGDPRVGSKIRAVSRELGSVNIDEVVEAYSQRYPADQVAGGRASRALEPDLSAISAGVRIVDGVANEVSVPSHEDDVLDRLTAASRKSSTASVVKVPRRTGGKKIS